MLIMLSWSY